MKNEAIFNLTGEKIGGAIQGKLFGKPCFKLKGKAFICFFQDEMVFKLNKPSHSDALSLDGSQLFDPSGKNRPMREWVQVPIHYKDQWDEFCQAAASYIGG